MSPADELGARIDDIREAIIDSVRAGDDLGGVLSIALGQAAIRLGGVEQLVRGRPGSWEAADIRHLAEPHVLTFVPP